MSNSQHLNHNPQTVTCLRPSTLSQKPSTTTPEHLTTPATVYINVKTYIIYRSGTNYVNGSLPNFLAQNPRSWGLTFENMWN